MRRLALPAAANSTCACARRGALRLETSGERSKQRHAFVRLSRIPVALTPAAKMGPGKVFGLDGHP